MKLNSQVKQLPQGINRNGNPTVNLVSPRLPPQADLWSDQYKGPKANTKLNQKNILTADQRLKNQIHNLQDGPT